MQLNIRRTGTISTQLLSLQLMLHQVISDLIIPQFMFNHYLITDTTWSALLLVLSALHSWGQVRGTSTSYAVVYAVSRPYWYLPNNPTQQDTTATVVFSSACIKIGVSHDYYGCFLPSLSVGKWTMDKLGLWRPSATGLSFLDYFLIRTSFCCKF